MVSKYLTIVLALTIFFASSHPTFSQTSPSMDAAEIKLQLKKLNTLGTVLYVAAHPDDENTRLIAYLANEKLYRTAYLSLTRGDGGQNLIGDEQAELLGLIRTQELLAARKTDGGEQFFTRANDFGYSKNPDETQKIWERDKILSDVVWVIRNVRPDVIICRFPTTGEGGHGHHTTSAILAEEAFEAAADPKKYLEQLKFVKTWQAKRLLWNTFNFGSTNTTNPNQFKIDVGAYNPLLGKGYGEIAAESRSMHKSQGFGVPRGRGGQIEYFKTLKGDAPQNNLMDGIKTDWSRLNESKIEELITKVNNDYNVENPALVIPQLLEIRKQLLGIKDESWKHQKLKEVENLIVVCSGLWFEAYASDYSMVPGQTIEIKSYLINRSNIPVTLEKISYSDKDTILNKIVTENQLLSFARTITLNEKTPYSQPYWLIEKSSIGAFKINDQNLVGLPENPSHLNVNYQIQIGGQSINFHRPVVYKSTDPVKGEIYRPLEINPPVVANIAEQVYLFTTNQSQTVKIKLKSLIGKVSGKASLKLPANYKSSETSIAFSFEKKGDELEINFNVAPIKISENNSNQKFQVNIDINGKIYNLSIRTIDYDHIPAITLFPLAEASLVNIDLKIAGKKIGYINGAGDKVAALLKQVGYNVTIIGENEIMNGDLSRFDAIITGVRAYNTQERLRHWQPKLMEYVKNGGLMLVQYNTSQILSSIQLGPYPFNISRERVTDETAKVTFINPENSVLNSPNKITEKDFDGWIQERGLYFTSNEDAQYQKIFRMNDPGESPYEGSTIVANYGKGKYIYTSLSFFRELPAGVPGAYRLFVNLISK